METLMESLAAWWTGEARSVSLMDLVEAVLASRDLIRIPSDRRWKLYVAAMLSSSKWLEEVTWNTRIVSDLEAVADGRKAYHERMGWWSHDSNRPETGLEMVTRLGNWREDEIGREVLTGLLFEMLGNPFDRPVWVPGEEILTWQCGRIPLLAQEAYRDKCWSLLPILADMLEDAGCTCREVMDHLRSDSKHVKGCWALDMVMGKEY